MYCTWTACTLLSQAPNLWDAVISEYLLRKKRSRSLTNPEVQGCALSWRNKFHYVLKKQIPLSSKFLTNNWPWRSNFLLWHWVCLMTQWKVSYDLLKMSMTTLLMWLSFFMQAMTYFTLMNGWSKSCACHVLTHACNCLVVDSFDLLSTSQPVKVLLMVFHLLQSLRDVSLCKHLLRAKGFRSGIWLFEICESRQLSLEILITEWDCLLHVVVNCWLKYPAFWEEDFWIGAGLDGLSWATW